MFVSKDVTGQRKSLIHIELSSISRARRKGVLHSVHSVVLLSLLNSESKNRKKEGIVREKWLFSVNEDWRLSGRSLSA